MHHRQLRAASAALTAAAVILWCLAAAATWAVIGPRALPLYVGGAAVASVIAALCWAVRAVLGRDDERFRQLAEEYQSREYLIMRSAARLVGAAVTGPHHVPSGPHRRLRPVR